ARVAELEKRIGEKEQAVRELERLMASPGFYDDRARAEQAVADRQRLLDEVGALMGEWESAQA
ncbi:MAG TPA: ABC transporter C-terminal domain-containing protein, partial [Vicinamibacteria bacterium]|nr:ABC transporter C-terminal domain-containing protein [Vicinamibacteria bacterium]